MDRSTLSRLVVSIILSMLVCVFLATSATVTAQEERIELTTKYPVRVGASDATFEFSVELKYRGGEEPRVFELSVERPEGWLVSVLQSATGPEVPAVRLDPSKAYGDTVVVHAQPVPWLSPELGDYTITLRAASGEVTGSLNLTARITARYEFSAETIDGRHNVKAVAGENNYLTLTITNTGTAPLNKMTFQPTKPPAIAGESWTVTFDPDKLESLSPEDEQQVEVTIKPPSKAIAGLYDLKLRFNSDPPVEDSPVLQLRIEVGTSTKWGWIGTAIVIAVIVGLFFVVRQFGRR